MCVQYDGGEDGEEHVESDEKRNCDTAEDRVAQQTTQRPDITLVEDGVLVGENDTRVTQTPTGGRPLACVQAGDEEVVEVDADTEDGSVPNEEPPGIRRGDDDCDDRTNDDRDEKVLFRVDDRSPVSLTPATRIKPTAFEAHTFEAQAFELAER